MDIKELIETLNKKGYGTEYKLKRVNYWLTIFSHKGEVLYKFPVPENFNVKKLLIPIKDLVIIPEAVCSCTKSSKKIELVTNGLYELDKFIREINSLSWSKDIDSDMIEVKFNYIIGYEHCSGSTWRYIDFRVILGELDFGNLLTYDLINRLKDQKFRELLKDKLIRCNSASFNYNLMDDSKINEYVSNDQSLKSIYDRIDSMLNYYTPNRLPQVFKKLNKFNIVEFNNGIYRVDSLNHIKGKFEFKIKLKCIYNDTDPRDLTICTHIE